MRKIFSLIIFAALFINADLSAQDKHFTQYFAVPTLTNPALAGAFQGRYRMGIVRRDQWRQTLETPYVTFAGGVDVRFDTNHKKYLDFKMNFIDILNIIKGYNQLF